MKHSNSKKPQIDTNEIVTLYEKGLSTTQIGEKLGMFKSSVGKRLKKAGISTRRSKDYEGEKRYWLWKGQDYIDPIIRKYNQRRLRKWSKAVRDRDNHTCQDCGRKDTRLHAHHIVFIQNCINSELEFDPKNGITLCVKCHKHRHKEQGA